MRQTIIGFDSAWADNSPGGICSLTLDKGKIVEFLKPRLVRFSDAALFVQTAKNHSAYVLIALDQPTLVPNSSGIRPVERVAGAIVNRIGGGVQPTNTSKVSMFGRSAPIWSFLDTINARENPVVARNANQGVFLIEVFPALALPSLIPEIWQRKRAAKYNPVARNFSPLDWKLVTAGMADLAKKHGLVEIAETMSALNNIPAPRKGDQDKLDAVISLMIGYIWRYGDPEKSIVIGDEYNGYMVAPASSEIKKHLKASADRLQVAYNRDFAQDALRPAPEAITDPEPHIIATVLECKETIISSKVTERRQCPECGHRFSGKGWGGIDAYWRAHHQDILRYEDAWPLIRKGLKPSDLKHQK